MSELAKAEGLGNDIFESGDADEDEAEAGTPAEAFPQGFEDLPVEIQSLMER